MTDRHGARAFYCDDADRYVLGRTETGNCPFCGADLTGDRYEHVQNLVEEHTND